VTDTSGHFQFLGWQPTLGELIINIIWPLVVAVLVALLVEPLRRWLSRTWDSLSDHLASLSESRRAKRIETLELKIKSLKEYDDRKLLTLFMRRIVSLIVLFGFLLLISILVARIDLIGGGVLAAKLLESGAAPLNETNVSQHWLPLWEFIYGVIHGMITVLFIFTVATVTNTFQDINDFSDPPKAIQRLEERIKSLNALRVKRLMS
jgi:hypothetical protein